MKNGENTNINTLDYKFWYEVSTYGNAHWKGSFTPAEVAENAHNYTCEFQACFMCDVPNETIAALCDLLADDSTEEAWEFWKMIKVNSRFCEDYVTEIESHFKEE